MFNVILYGFAAVGSFYTVATIGVLIYAHILGGRMEVDFDW